MLNLVKKQQGVSGGTDREHHRYFSEFYQHQFKKYQDQPITLLEIGSAYGGGLIIWHEYFSQAKIIGAELRDHTPEGKLTWKNSDPNFRDYPEVFLPNLDDYPRMQAFNGYDAYQKSFADNLPDLDIVIDDGWHSCDQWEKLYELYLPKIRPGGMLIIEDISDRPIRSPQGWTINQLIEPVKHLQHQVFDFRSLTGKDDSRILAIWI